jgi:hypothetical protein
MIFYKTIHKFTAGDSPVILKQSKISRLFTVIYGLQVKKGLPYERAVNEYGSCVFHSLACAGVLDQGGH